MWDARLEAIRDRKTNEMIIFAAMVRTDGSKRHEYVRIIQMLSDDLDLIESIAENKPLPETRPIESEIYRSRLSKMEQMDEYCLDACRNGENDFGPIICKEHMSTSVAVKQDAQVAVQQKSESPAVIPEYPKPVRVESPTPSEISVPETPSPMPEQKGNVPPEIVPPEVPAAPEPQVEIPADAGSEIQSPEASDEDGIYDLVISIEDAVSLKKVREMKDLKIDLFIDREMNGHFNDNACEDVISFLKTDVKLINTILSININSKDDIESKIKIIVDIVANADEPAHTTMYLNSLNEDEKKLEGEYNEVLKRLESSIASRYSHILGDQESLFFR